MSNAILDAAIAEGIAALTQSVPWATPPLLWGSDVSCDVDLDPTTIIESDDVLVLVQAMHRRLSTPRGKLVDDPAYGWDIAAELHVGLTQKQIESMSRRIGSEIRKDDRIASASVKVTTTNFAREVRIAITVQPVNPSTGTFRAIMLASSAGLVLEEISRP